ncbi:MAG TPA: DUF4304 domain-containing protein [Pyrinomonadaceae bacterium]
MTAHRNAILRALKEVFVPALRAGGFSGTFPHFRRVLPDRVDYLTVQFYSSGGSFVVEIATAGPDGKPVGYGRHLPVEKLNVSYFSNRLRLGSDRAGGKADHWYVFGPRSYDAPEPLRPFEHYLAIGRQVTADLERQGEPWFMAHAGAA